MALMGNEQMEREDHDWHMKPTATPAELFKDPKFCAAALRRMVANCVAMHASGQSVYTDGERKLMTAAAEHLDVYVKRISN